MEKLDVVYLSPDLSSLFGAVLLAAGGLKVLVLDGERKSLSKPSEADLVWESAPKEPFLLRGLKPGAFLEPIFQRLGFLKQAQENFESFDPPLQVITPDARVDIWPGKEDMAREFAREFGPGARNGATLFQGFEELGAEVYRITGNESFPAVPKGIAPRFFKRPASNPEVQPLRAAPFSRVLADHSLSGEFQNVLLAAMAALGAQPAKGTSAAAAAALLDSMRRGVYRADLSGLTKLIISDFKNRNGYTFPLQEMEAAEITGREISALRMTKNNIVKSRLFIGSAASWAEYTPREVSTALVPPNSWRVHRLELMVHSDAIPVGMNNRVAAVSGTNGVRAERTLRISISPAFQFENAPTRIVTAESIRPGTEDARAELKESLAGIIPFLSEYLKNERYTVEQVSRRPDPERPFLELPPNGPIDNLLPNESELLADMGLGDGVISGRILPRVILRKLGLRSDI